MFFGRLGDDGGDFCVVFVSLGGVKKVKIGIFDGYRGVFYYMWGCFVVCML